MLMAWIVSHFVKIEKSEAKEILAENLDSAYSNFGLNSLKTFINRVLDY